MITQLEVRLGNHNAINSEYSLDANYTTGWTLGFKGKVEFGLDMSTCTFITSNMQDHTDILLTWEEKNYYYFFQSKQVVNSNLYQYMYVLDCKQTYREEMGNVWVTRQSLNTLNNEPSAVLDYPHLPIEKQSVTKPIPKGIFICTTKKTGANGLIDTTVPNCLDGNGVPLSFDTFFFSGDDDGLIETSSFSQFTFGWENINVLKRDNTWHMLGGGTATFNLKKPTESASPGAIVKIPFGESYDITVSTPAFDLYVKFSFGLFGEDCEFQYLGNGEWKAINKRGRTPWFWNYTVSKPKYPYNADYIFKDGNFVLPEIGKVANVNVVKQSVYQAMNNNINNLVNDKREILSVQNCYLPDFSLQQQAVGSSKYNIVVGYPNSNISINVEQGFTPVYLEVYGETVEIKRQLLINNRIDLCISYLHDPINPICNVALLNSPVVVKENIACVPIVCSLPYNTTAWQDYSLNNSQSLALLQNQKEQAKWETKMQNKSMLMNFAFQSGTAGLRAARDMTNPTVGSVAAATGFSMLNMVGNLAPILLSKQKLDRQISQIDLKYRLETQQIKDQPALSVYGNNVAALFLSNSFGIFLIYSKWQNPEVSNFIQRFGVTVNKQSPTNLAPSGFIQAELLPNTLPTSINELYNAQLSFYYKTFVFPPAFYPTVCKLVCDSSVPVGERNIFYGFVYGNIVVVQSKTYMGTEYYPEMIYGIVQGDPVANQLLGNASYCIAGDYDNSPRPPKVKKYSLQLNTYPMFGYQVHRFEQYDVQGGTGGLQIPQHQFQAFAIIDKTYKYTYFCRGRFCFTLNTTLEELIERSGTLNEETWYDAGVVTQYPFGIKDSPPVSSGRMYFMNADKNSFWLKYNGQTVQFDWIDIYLEKYNVPEN